jgi:DNA-binding NarL/FixJ family response regulator
MRTVIVAEDARSAETIRQALRHAPDCSLLGYIEPGRESLGPLRGCEPDLVLLDGCDADYARQARAAVPGATLVLFADVTEDQALERARTAGVDAIIARDCPATSVSLLVRELAAGNMFFFAQPGRRAATSPEGDQLTARELDLIRLATRGESNKTIARHLWVTEATVKAELAGLYRKFGVSDNAELSHYARAQGLVESTDAGPNGAATPLAAVA